MTNELYIDVRYPLLDLIPSLLLSKTSKAVLSMHTHGDDNYPPSVQSVFTVQQSGNNTLSIHEVDLMGKSTMIADYPFGQHSELVNDLQFKFFREAYAARERFKKRFRLNVRDEWYFQLH